jgi:hypothetical protein
VAGRFDDRYRQSVRGEAGKLTAYGHLRCGKAWCVSYVASPSFGQQAELLRAQWRRNWHSCGLDCEINSSTVAFTIGCVVIEQDSLSQGTTGDEPRFDILEYANLPTRHKKLRFSVEQVDFSGVCLPEFKIGVGPSRWCFDTSTSVA